MINRFILLLCLVMSNMSLSASDLPPEENRMQPDHLPTPFSAEELKAFNVPGYRTLFRIEGEGRAPVLNDTVWLPSEEGLAVFSNRMKTPDGVPIGEVQTGTAEWEELQSHASFPAAATSLSTETIEVPAGKFDCWRYDVAREVPSDGQAPRTLVMTFWFAKELPGPPVLMEHRLDGRVTMTMTLLSCTRPESEE